MLASRLPQSDRISNHYYERPTHIEVINIPFLVPSQVLAQDDTLKKAFIGDICQYINRL